MNQSESRFGSGNGGEELKLPFDFKTLLISLKQHWFWFIIIILAAGSAGIYVGLEYGSRVYEASTVLSYQPISNSIGDEFEVQQSIDENTQMIYRQSSRQFQESFAGINIETQKNLVKIPSNIETVRNNLSLEKSTSELGSSIDVSVTRGTNLMTISARASDPQTAADIAETIRDIFLEMNIQINRAEMDEWLASLRGQYEDAAAQLQSAQSELNAFIDEYSLGDTEVLSDEYTRRLIDLEMQIKTRRNEIRGLEKQLSQISVQLEEELRRYVPSNAEYVNDLRMKKIDIEMQLLSMKEQLEGDQDLYEELAGEISGLPELRDTYIKKSNVVNSLEAENRGLSKMYSQAKRIYDKGVSDFTIISDPSPPVFPVSSTRRIFAAITALLIGMLGLTIIILRELFDTRIKSDRDAAQKTGLKILGSFPRVRNRKLLLPGSEQDGIHIERYRITARPLRTAYPSFGTAFLVTSTTAQEGKTTTAVNLAAVFGRRDERVLLLDAQVRRRQTSLSYEKILFQEQKTSMGLGEYLSFMTNETADIIQPTILAGVDAVSIHTEAVIPDLLHSNRMKTLIEELKQQYSIIIVEASDVTSHVDAEVLAEYCSAILFVIRCGKAKSEHIRKALKRLKQTPVPVEGAVITDMDAAYL